MSEIQIEGTDKSTQSRAWVNNKFINRVAIEQTSPNNVVAQITDLQSQIALGNITGQSGLNKCGLIPNRMPS